MEEAELWGEDLGQIPERVEGDVSFINMSICQITFKVVNSGTL